MSSGHTAFHNGLAAEDIVARAYEARGASILARRWKVRAGEIDLIVQSGETLVFVEVKARKTLALALSALQPKQQARLIACAEQYLKTHADLSADCRFDLAGVDQSGTVEIIENALQ